MVAHRRKDLVISRRRVDDEGEEEAGSEAAALDDDSLSEATLLSDSEDEDADAEGSDISEHEPAEVQPAPAKEAPGNGHIGAMNGGMKEQHVGTSAQKDKTTFQGSEDTHAMLNGLQKPGEPSNADEVDFEDMKEPGGDVQAVSTNGKAETQSSARKPELPHERRRREQEEYKRKRDADPTFVPNRGGFFMHDHRHSGPASNGFRPFGKGRGRGTMVAPFLQPNHGAQTTMPSNEQWSHDLHEVVQEEPPPVPRGGYVNGRSSSTGPRLPHSAPKPPSFNRSFSKTTHISNVQIRVFLPNMPDPITFSGVPVRQHTRLPEHRPPLRRDKPVRVSLPAHPPRYIFPSVERSFIFIPRALRPNQQGHGRTAGRGGFGPYRGHSSRRTSTYGGSMYSPSVAMSRRSSLAQEITRDSITPRSGSTASRPPPALLEQGRPVVRLPPATERPRPAPQPVGPFKESPVAEPTAPGHPLAPGPPHPPGQYLAYRENRSMALTMHQPRPQKTVSVAGIESPEQMSFPPPPPQQQQQPFHHQVPLEVNGNGNGVAGDGPQHPRSRRTSRLSQPAGELPLPQIPERAIHAQPFLPQFVSAAPAPFYAPSFAGAVTQSPSLYPPSADPRMTPYAPSLATSAASAPIFVPGQPPGAYVVGLAPPAPAPAPAPAGAGGTFAQESNGMVYYYDAAQVYGAGAGFAPTAYAVTPTGTVVSVGGVVAPGPEGYFYPPTGTGAVYYGP